MGRWGNGLFEGDDDYDYVGTIESAARCRLFHPRRSKALVAQRLDGGLTMRLAEKFKDQPPYLVFLGALVVRNGGHVSLEFREAVRQAIGKTPLTDKQWNQICDAFIEYTNAGTPYDFKSKGLFEVLEENLVAGKTGLINV